MGLLDRDPSVAYRGGLLPYLARTVTDPIDDVSEYEQLEWALPGLLYEPLSGMAKTGGMLAGNVPIDPRVMTQTMVDAPLVGGLLGAATGAVPKGAVLGAFSGRWLDKTPISGKEVVEVDIEKLMGLVPKGDRISLSAQKGDLNVIGDRIQRAKNWFASDEKMELPQVSAFADDTGEQVSISDGRHRLIAAYQLGEKTAPVLVDKAEAGLLRDRAGVTLGANKPPTAALPGLLSDAASGRGKGLMDDLPQYRTSDGHTFYKQKDGTLTDHPDPEMSDMTFDSLQSMADDFGSMPLPVGKNEIAEKRGGEAFIREFASFMDDTPGKLPDDVLQQRAINKQKQSQMSARERAGAAWEQQPIDEVPQLVDALTIKTGGTRPDVERIVDVFLDEKFWSGGGIDRARALIQSKARNDMANEVGDPVKAHISKQLELFDAIAPFLEKAKIKKDKFRSYDFSGIELGANKSPTAALPGLLEQQQQNGYF